MKTIKRQTLDRLLQEHRERGAVVFAPRRFDYGVDFAPLSRLDEMSTTHIQTVQSPKFALFPRVEEMFHFNRSGEAGYRIEETDLDKSSQIILLGTRPCDAAGLLTLESIFHWETIDPLVRARRKKMVVITIVCSRSDPSCFCTSVGLDPAGSTGSDLLLQEREGGNYTVEIISDKGLEWLKPAAAELIQGAEDQTVAPAVRLPACFSADRIIAGIKSLFDKKDFWLGQSLRCTGCGACAYVCPTCACFDIQDEGSTERGKRLRCWDSCGFSLFTRHASGHNPREQQFERWRQRLMHKFSYMPDRQGTLGCVGCGRCSRSCPVDMNILEHLQEIAENLP